MGCIHHPHQQVHVQGVVLQDGFYQIERTAQLLREPRLQTPVAVDPRGKCPPQEGVHLPPDRVDDEGLGTGRALPAQPAGGEEARGGGTLADVALGARHAFSAGTCPRLGVAKGIQGAVDMATASFGGGGGGVVCMCMCVCACVYVCVCVHEYRI